MKHSTGVHLIIRADKKILVETVIETGNTTVLDLEALIAKKNEMQKHEAYCCTREAMKHAKGFIRDISHLPLRYKLGCTMKGVVKPLANNVFQKLKAVSEKNNN